MERTYPLAPLTYLKHVLTWTKNMFRKCQGGKKKKMVAMSKLGEKELQHYTLVLITLTTMGIIKAQRAQIFPHNCKPGVCHTVALPFTLKSILR